MADNYPEGYDDFAANECWNCGGEGHVFDCIDGCCEDAEVGCDLCTRRCDVCKPAPPHPTIKSEADQ